MLATKFSVRRGESAALCIASFLQVNEMTEPKAVFKSLCETPDSRPASNRSGKRLGISLRHHHVPAHFSWRNRSKLSQAINEAADLVGL